MTALSLDGATLYYDALKAVDNIDFELSPGEICALVGPNGSGKTSLLNVISGFTKATHGSIHVGGTDVTHVRPHAVARLGVARTFQLVRLLHGLTVEDNVAAGCTPVAGRRGAGVLVRSLLTPRRATHRERDRIDEAMARAGVTELANTLVDQLAFGFQRRVEIARAIVSRPKLLLLDEPAAGLSEHDLDELATVINTEAERGCAVILVDHHLDFVLRMCPRAIVLNFGTKIFDGASAAAVEDPQVREAYVGT